MKKIEIAARDQTPFVILDKQNGRFEIRGYSYPDEALEFYTEILDWFKEYIKNPNAETKFIFDLIYVNSTSIKFINEILKKLDGLFLTGKTVTVEWFFMSDDEDMQQLGNVLKDFHKVPVSVSVKPISKGSDKQKMF
ncbi:MAG TPA: DUF1987 domain-containing protein [Bacteroidia bacterium]|jgi:hypothetical protein|nr:DUF1987 domain-containing protein [Bacteroidia bacterium]